MRRQIWPQPNMKKSATAMLAVALAAQLAVSGVTSVDPPTAIAGEPTPPELVSIATGGYWACALLSGGSLACWGFTNRSGLGVGTRYSSVVPKMLELDAPATAISVGDEHACALLQDETLRCWGNNNYGEVGIEPSAPLLEPVAVPGIDHVASIAAGANHTCAVRDDGTAWCWGNGALGQLGVDPIQAALPAQVPGITEALAVAGGSRHTCVLLEDASVTCFGYWGTEDGQFTIHPPTPVGDFEGVTALAGGGDHTCGLISDGTVRCFGENWAGQLGDGTQSNRDSAMPVAGIEDAVAVGAGWAHTCTATGAGELFCWGHDGAGQLGLPPSDAGFQLLPQLVEGVSGVSSIDGAYGFTCAVATGVGKCWGSNGEGSLGDRTLESRWEPGPISWVPDDTLPTAEPPTLEIHAKSRLGYDGRSFRVDIAAAADDGLDGTGIDHLEVRTSYDGGDTWGSIKWRRYPSSRWTRLLEPTGTVTIQVRAVDRAGNAGDWATSAVLSPRIRQQGNDAISYDGNWQIAENEELSGGSSAYTTSDGASATFTFTGRSVGLVSRKGKNRGEFRVFVDGVKVGVIDLYTTNSIRRYRVLVWAQSWADSTEHTIRLVAVGTAGRPRVDVDAFVVLE